MGILPVSTTAVPAVTRELGSFVQPRINADERGYGAERSRRVRTTHHLLLDTSHLNSSPNWLCPFTRLLITGYRLPPFDTSLLFPLIVQWLSYKPTGRCVKRENRELITDF